MAIDKSESPIQQQLTGSSYAGLNTAESSHIRAGQRVNWKRIRAFFFGHLRSKKAVEHLITKSESKKQDVHSTARFVLINVLPPAPGENARASTSLLCDMCSEYITEPQTSLSTITKGLRLASLQRAYIYHSKLDLANRAKILQHCRNEATKATAILDQELSRHPPESTGFDTTRISSLIASARRGFADLATAESRWDDVNEKLKEKEQHLQETDEQLFFRVTGREISSNLTVLDEILNLSNSRQPSPLLQPTIFQPVPPPLDNAVAALSEVSLGRDVNGIDLDSTSAQHYPQGHESTASKEIHDPGRNLITHSPQSLEPVLDLTTFLDDEAPTSVVDTDADTAHTGIQFAEYDSDANHIVQDLSIENEDFNHICEKRKRDLLTDSALTPSFDLMKPAFLEIYLQADVISESLRRMIDVWFLQTFAQSWLEFSHFLWFSHTQLEKLASTIGYIHLTSLIYANWFCDGSTLDMFGVPSVNPTISSLSVDVPLFYQQIVHHSSKGSDVAVYTKSLRHEREMSRLQSTSYVPESMRDHCSAHSRNSSGGGSRASDGTTFSSPLRRVTSRTDRSGDNLSPLCS